MILRERARVTTVGDTGDVELEASMPCLMVHMSVQPMASSQDRDELAARRKLYFPAEVQMPEYAQVQIVGEPELWNVVAGTFAKMSGPSRRPSYKRCELIRASDG